MGLTRKADIVFCIDISASMQPCIDAVKAQIDGFVDKFRSDPQIEWDLRLGLLAHRATSDPDSQDKDDDIVVGTRLVTSSGLGGPMQTLYNDPEGVFTRDVEQFRRVLATLEAEGDEAMLFALDCALDFPWRDALSCHRVVVMMTDEPIEDGLMRRRSEGLINELTRKVMDLHVMLFVIGPDSEMLEQLSMADRSEWELVDGYDGLRAVDFRKLLQSIARSISVSSTGLQGAKTVERGLFGQKRYTPVEKAVEFVGR